jgi:hypothetical protein
MMQSTHALSIRLNEQICAIDNTGSERREERGAAEHLPIQRVRALEHALLLPPGEEPGLQHNGLTT